VDRASPLLTFACAEGTVYPTAQIDIRKSGATHDFYSIIMTGVVVTSVSGSWGNGNTNISESVTLNFDQIQWKYTKLAGGDTDTAWWNIVDEVGGTNDPPSP
jgi:type VI secretion system Hcp family effector